MCLLDDCGILLVKLLFFFMCICDGGPEFVDSVLLLDSYFSFYLMRGVYVCSSKKHQLAKFRIH